MNDSINFLKRIDKGAFLIIYFILLLFSGYYFFEYSTIPAYVVVGGLIMLRVFRRRIKKNSLLLWLILASLLCCTDLISALYYQNSGYNITLLILPVLSLLIACLFYNSVDRNIFKESYISCMTIIAIVSVVSIVIYIIIPSLIEVLPVLRNSKGRIGYFGIFTVVSDFLMTGSHRNQGIFWEPGAFQAFLSLAYIFELSNVKQRKWVLISILIAMFSTLSTTGIIVAVLLITFTLSRQRGKTSVIKALCAVIILIAAVYYVVPRLTGFLEYTLVRKIELILNYQAGTSNAASSRMDSILYPLKELFTVAPWGIGRAGYIEIGQKVGHTMFTCTPVNWIVRYGTLYGAILMYGIWKFFKTDFKDTLDSAVIFIIFLLSISSEELSMNIIFLYMCFAGYTNFGRKKLQG